MSERLSRPTIRSLFPVGLVVANVLVSAAGLVMHAWLLASSSTPNHEPGSYWIGPGLLAVLLPFVVVALPFVMATEPWLPPRQHAERWAELERRRRHLTATGGAWLVLGINAALVTGRSLTDLGARSQRAPWIGGVGLAVVVGGTLLSLAIVGRALAREARAVVDELDALSGAPRAEARDPFPPKRLGIGVGLDLRRAEAWWLLALLTLPALVGAAIAVWRNPT